MPFWENSLVDISLMLTSVETVRPLKLVFSSNSVLGKKIAQQLVSAIETAFVANLAELNWMDATTKVAAQQKLEAITNKIGYPDKWTKYDSVIIQPGNSPCYSWTKF